MNDVGFIFTVCIMSCGVLFFFGMGLWQLRQFRNLTKRYCQVYAKVISVEIEIREPDERFDYWGELSTYCPFAPAVECEYEVDGKQYTSKAVTPFDEAYSHRWMVKRIIKRYGPGQVTRLFFDPGDPTRVFLKCGPSPYVSFGLALFGMVMLVMLWIITRSAT